MITPFIQGLGTGAGLIVAIGAQNAFVLSQSIRGKYRTVIAMICIFCDVIYFTAGVSGLGMIVSTSAILRQWITWMGAAFLVYYGWKSFCSAFQGGSLDADCCSVASLRAAVIATLAVTVLNPHVYLDTLIICSVSNRFHGESRLLFWAGAVSSSIIWFFCLSFGGRALAPFFTKQLSWRILDSLVCLTMWSIAVSLFINGVSL